MTRISYGCLAALLVLMVFRPAAAQAPAKSPAVSVPEAAKQSLSLAERGKCKEALQVLKKSTAPTTDKELKLKAGVAAMRCAIDFGQTETAVEAIQMLNREFPHDPAVLYFSAHAYSDLSTRASLELARTAPNSYQAHEMNAESLEIQGRWDDAEKEYQSILRDNPNVPEIHFRLGRLLLSRPNPTSDSVERAKQELRKEVEINPHNAAAEYVLGELARQENQWPEAIDHFKKATQLDAAMMEAQLGLGMTFVADGKAQEAIPPLESYVKSQPADPTGHYQLAMAYSRAGRREDAKREAALQRETAERIEQEKQKAGDARRQQGPEGQKPQAPN